ncbi:MAG: tetratricopeptide repeat protein [Bacteroidota bacterium]
MASKAKVREQEAEVIEEVLEEGGSSIDTFIAQNKNLLLVGVGVILLIIGGLAFFNYTKEAQNTEAHAEMFRAVKYFEVDSLDRALNGDGGMLGFLDIENDYSGTAAANMAKYYIGIIYLKQGNTDDGIEYLESFSKGDDFLSMGAYTALGFAYEDQGDASKAASLFEKAARTPAENDKTTPTMLLNAGRNYEAAGNPGKAKSLYQEIKDEYPFSSEGLNIDKYLGRVAGA